MRLGYPRTELRQKLVDSVLRGAKTATAGLRVECEPPRVGARFVLLGFDDERVAVVQTTEVRVLRAADVDLALVVWLRSSRTYQAARDVTLLVSVLASNRARSSRVNVHGRRQRPVGRLDQRGLSTVQTTVGVFVGGVELLLKSRAVREPRSRQGSRGGFRREVTVRTKAASRHHCPRSESAQSAVVVEP